MTKAELIKIIEQCPEDIDIAININGLIYDITDCCLAIDIDTNNIYVKLGNIENEDKFRENRFNKIDYSQFNTESEDIAKACDGLDKRNWKENIMERITNRYNAGKSIEFTKRFNCNDAIEKLAMYEDLEEQELLLRLPCKFGTILYSVSKDCNNVEIL